MHLLRIIPLFAVLGCVLACGNDVIAPGLSGEDVAPSAPEPKEVHEDGDPATTVDPGEERPEVPPARDPPVVTYIVAVSPTTQSALAGTWVEHAPQVEVRNQYGGPMPGQRVRFTVESGGGLLAPWLVTTDAAGRAKPDLWRLGTSVVPNHVTVTLADHPEVASVAFDATVSTDFSITVRFLSEVTDAQRAAFDNAAARWAALITNDLPDFVTRRTEMSTACAGAPDNTAINVDDVLIFAQVVAIDGPSNTLAQAGPCWQREDGSTGIGIMSFDSADLANVETKHLLDTVVLHEMGHVLGIGTYWKDDDLVAAPSLPSSPGVNTTYTGSNAVAAFTEMGGSGFPNAVPLDNTAVIGSADAHWRESVFTNELMTPTITGKETRVPLSAVTVASLQDLGCYTVNMAASDSFSLMPALRSTTEPSDDGEVLGACEVMPVTEVTQLPNGFRRLR